MTSENIGVRRTAKLGDYIVWHYEDFKQEPGYLVVYVPSSEKKDEITGEPWLYTVIVEKDGTYDCDCWSYQTRRYCRHVTEVKKRLSSRPSAPA